MAKELPYFKFEPAEYLTKNISFCSLSAQGLFINICSYYWQRNCKLTIDQVLKRLNYQEEVDELISEGIIDLNGEFITIKFLDNQLVDVEKTSKQNSANGAKGGRPKKPIESENKPTALIPLSETKGIREDKIIIDNKDNSIIDRKLKFSTTLIPFLETYDRDLIRAFYDYWTEHGENDKKMRFEKEKSFGLGRRLATWNKNNFGNNTNNKKQTQYDLTRLTNKLRAT
jgi:hypothetical protein